MNFKLPNAIQLLLIGAAVTLVDGLIKYFNSGEMTSSELVPLVPLITVLLGIVAKFLQAHFAQVAAQKAVRLADQASLAPFPGSPAPRSLPKQIVREPPVSLLHTILFE